MTQNPKRQHKWKQLVNAWFEKLKEKNDCSMKLTEAECPFDSMCKDFNMRTLVFYDLDVMLMKVGVRM